MAIVYHTVRDIATSGLQIDGHRIRRIQYGAQRRKKIWKSLLT